MTLIIVAAIIVLAGAYCLALETFWLSGKGQVAVRPVQQNQAVDEMANWKTYSNTQDGFEFKYPKTFEVFRDEFGNVHIIHPEDKALDLSNKGPIDGVWIYTTENKNKLSVIDWWNKAGPYTTKASLDMGVKPDTFPIEKMTIDGVDGIYIGGTEGVLSNYLVLPYMGKIISINLMANDSMKILSTFKFIDSGLIDISDGKTHRNEKYGFEVKYPIDWVIEDREDGVDVYKSKQQMEQVKQKDNNYGGDVYPEFNITIAKEAQDPFIVYKEEIEHGLYKYGIKNINGVDIKYVFVGDSFSHPAYYFSKGDRQIILNMYQAYKDNSIVEKILSTFKFIDSGLTNTSDWKTYSNGKYGFEIKYPVNTQINNTNDRDTLSNQTTLMGMTFKPATSRGILIINVRGANVDLAGSPTCYDTALGADPSFPNINGISFVKWDISKYISGGIGPWDDGREYCVIHNKVAYNLILETASDPSVSEAPNVDKDSVLNQMLATFKFTGWKTYYNEKLGFELKYPEELQVTTGDNYVNFHKDCSSLRNGNDLVASMRCDLESDMRFAITNKTIDEFIEGYKGDFMDGVPLSRIISQENYILDGISGKKLEGNNAEGIGGGYFIYVTKNGKNYFISYGVDDISNFQTQVISTFKFIN